MKKFFLLFVLSLLSFNAFASDALNYILIRNPYHFSTYYEMFDKNDSYEGRLVEEFFHVRTTFDLYDKVGDYEGQGICRALSLGVIFPWAREIDVYDQHGHRVGIIIGKTLTTAKAKFEFYNQHSHHVGTAYCDLDGSDFLLMSPSEHVIGFLKRNHHRKGGEEWHAVLHNHEGIDKRVFKIFTAFIAKNHEHF